jgi:fructokinase
MIVLGGGVSNLRCIYDISRVELAKWVFCDVVDTLIVKHSLGDSAGVLGAAMLPS